LPHSSKKAPFSSSYQSKTVSSQFLFLPNCRQAGDLEF
jgi:hypothetical protein